MRFKSLLAALVALASIGLANPDPAAAFDHDRDRPEGWGHARPIRHWVYYPRYSHHYYVDPYAYQYSPRGYYPYYNSGYWTSASIIRARNRAHYNSWNVQPPRFRYYASWGRPAHTYKYRSVRRYHRWHY